MATIRIIIADNYRLFREGIKSLISNELDIEFIADAEDEGSLIKLLSRITPDIVILGTNMNRVGIIEVVTQISKNYPGIGIIMLSIHDEPAYILKCVKGGASAYLLKNVDSDELIFTIRKVAAKLKYFNQELDRLLQHGVIKQRFNIKISRREREVLDHLAVGLSTRQISEKLCLSTRTIESHRLSLLQKFEAQNSVELLRMAKERLLII